MFGQRASSQIVWRLAPWISFLTSKYFESALGARTFIHSGRRGRSATGSEVSTSRVWLRRERSRWLGRGGPAGRADGDVPLGGRPGGFDRHRRRGAGER